MVLRSMQATWCTVDVVRNSRWLQTLSEYLYGTVVLATATGVKTHKHGTDLSVMTGGAPYQSHDQILETLSLKITAKSATAKWANVVAAVEHAVTRCQQCTRIASARTHYL
jgi:hypothetical protein